MSKRFLENDYLSIEEVDIKDIRHEGVGHEDGGHSGRYPWGSGKDSFQRPSDFYSYVRHLENQGLSNIEIAQGLNMSTTSLKEYKSIAYNFRRQEMVDAARKLREKTDANGKRLTNKQIGIILGERYNEDKSPVNESQVRSLYDSEREARSNQAINTANILMNAVDKKGVIDVGTMVGKELGVTDDTMRKAIKIAEDNGYVKLYGSVEQVTNPGQVIRYVVLAPKGTPANAAYDYKNIHTINDYTSTDGGKSFRPAFVYPKSINPNRVAVRTRDEGGLQRDGTIEIRRGVKDLSLGSSNYAQVRILVDGGGGENDRYLKGMAVYVDGKDMPDGVDIIFNSNKPAGMDKMDYFKKTKENLEKDPNNPFGSAIKEHGGQSYYDDPNGEFTDPITGNKQSLSLINKRADAGDWNDWSKVIPSQMLAKQPKDTIAKQLKLTLQERQDEYDEIMKVDNPTVKAKLLEDFAADCDKSAADLKAAKFPGTTYHVILPVTSLKDNEVYAPNYKDGTQLALVRFPHGGTFEIPILTVNNRNKEALSKIGNDSIDAIGINSNVASRLSGADFDGDTVLTIPTNENGIDIRSTPALKGLANFDTGDYGPDQDGVIKDENGEKHYYRNGKEYQHITEDYKQIQMGVVSNLITDMTLKGAPNDEIERAVKHSMVVIDAYKHDLDYHASYEDNKIKDLHIRYQGKANGGASTLISRAKHDVEINKRTEGEYRLDQEGNPDNGNVLTLINPAERDNKLKIYKDLKTGKEYTDKDKKTVYIDPKTGEKLYRDTRESINKIIYINSDGNKIKANAYVLKDGKYKRPRYLLTEDEINNLYFPNDEGIFEKYNPDLHILEQKQEKEKVEMMYLHSDARDLSSGTIQEEYYAEYANRLKDIANSARLNYLYFDSNPIQYSPSAKAKYNLEVDSLEMKVRKAELNAPRERAANIIATSIVQAQVEASDQEYSDEDLKKLKQKTLTECRANFNAHNARFEITEKEWEAIQAGAFTKSRLLQILRYADPDVVKKLATPREELKLSDADIRRIKGLSSKGETNAAIAARLHVSLSTVVKYLGEEDK